MSTADPFDPGPPPGLLARLLSPARFVACLFGSVVTMGVLVAVLAVFEGPPPDLAAWWADPPAQLTRLGNELAHPHGGVAAFRCLLLAALVLPIWGSIGTFVIRADLLARDRRPDGGVAAARFVAARAGNLLGQPLLSAVLVGVVFVPTLLAAWATTWGGFGKTMVAVLLPFAFVSCVVTLAFVVGLFVFPLMPAVRAYEGEEGDQFDALSRGVNYTFQRPAACLLLAVFAVAAFVLFAAPLVLAGLSIPNGTALLPVAAALGFSAFWAVLSVGYAAVRGLVDGTPSGDVGWLESDPPALRPAEDQPVPEPRAAAAPTFTDRVWGYLSSLALVACSWALMVAALGWVGGDTQWVRWRFTGEADPGGFAAWVADVWLFLIAAFAVLMPLVRSAKKPAA